MTADTRPRPAPTSFELDLKTTALLLDVDGTLIDIGAAPFAVCAGRPAPVAGAPAGRTDGALALVSGRPIADLDRLFSPLMLPAVGGHGAEMRRTHGAGR